MFLIVSSMCTSLSTWQFISDPKRPRDIVDIEKKHGLLHPDWSMHTCARRRCDSVDTFYMNTLRMPPLGLNRRFDRCLLSFSCLWTQ